MSTELETAIPEICKKYGGDRTRMMDIVREVQDRFGCVNGEAMDKIAATVGTARVEVESVVSFYAFLSKEKKGDVVVRLCDDIIDRMKGSADVAAAIEKAAGAAFGETSSDGKFSLEKVPCIGLCDQAPAALINGVPVTDLTPGKAGEIIAALKADPDASKLVTSTGDGNNGHELVRSMVQNNVRKAGPVLFADWETGAGLKKALDKTDEEVIKEVQDSRLRGRGGAGFPTGLKWNFCRTAKGDQKFVICNADEGEPGTFKDRAILTEKPELLFEGMAVAGYAMGSKAGIVYLRAEYEYLQAFLEKTLEDMRAKNLLGKNILGKGFDFDIRIQMGAGAYVCGEETSLISSCEGLRGDPKDRPPFPAQKGYLGHPTNVNNVETYCAAARILDKGAAWFSAMGSKGSPGTKLLSVSGDCGKPGIYEVEFGMTVKDMLEMVGAPEAAAVQVAGPSGQLIGPSDFGRAICYDDLGTGGAMMVFGKDRDLLEVAEYFMDFFIEESCGYCTPCRVGNVLLKNGLKNVIDGKAEPADIDKLEELGKTIIATARCGLGQTSPNPVLTTIRNFRPLYEAKVKEAADGFQPTFDLSKATQLAADLTGRPNVN